MRLITRLLTSIMLLISIEGNAQFVFDTIPSPNSQAINYGKVLFIDNRGDIVTATSDTPFILKKYNYNEWYAPDSNSTIQYIADGVPSTLGGYPFDRNNNMWGGSDSVLVKINDSSVTTYRIPFYQYPSYIADLCIDDSNHIWTLMSIYDSTNTTQNSSMCLVKFDGVNWSKYRIIDYDTTRTYISSQPINYNAPSNMYSKNGKIYILNEYGSSGYFDGHYFTFSKYGWGDDPTGHVLGVNNQGVTLVFRIIDLISSVGTPIQTNTMTGYDSNENIIFIDTLPLSVNYPQIFAGGGIQQLDNNGTYWFQNTNQPELNTIYYYNPITHIAGSLGLPSYMGLIASGYFYLQNINYNPVRNTLVFNTTVSSTNLTNGRPNSRFMELILDSFYSYLANIDSVWPGDADNNRVVDNTDLLPIGLGYDSTGPVRTVTGIVWQADIAHNWSEYFSVYAPTVNFNHADCNGDGIINAADTTAIIANFSLTHSKNSNLPGPWRSGTPGFNLAFSVDTAANGDTLTTTISLGLSPANVNNLYGLAFTFNYDPAVIDTNTSTFSFVNSWIGSPNNSIHLAVNDRVAGTVKAAITGIDHTPRSGSGPIAIFSGGITTGNINGKDLSYYANKNYISDITAIDQQGNLIPLNAGIDSNYIAFTPNGIHDISQTAKVNIYPNPATTAIRVASGTAMSAISISDILGKEVSSVSVNNKLNESIDISALEEGVYIIRVSTVSGTATSKLVVSR